MRLGFFFSSPQNLRIGLLFSKNLRISLLVPHLSYTRKKSPLEFKNWNCIKLVGQIQEDWHLCDMVLSMNKDHIHVIWSCLLSEGYSFNNFIIFWIQVLLIFCFITRHFAFFDAVVNSIFHFSTFYCVFRNVIDIYVPKSYLCQISIWNLNNLFIFVHSLGLLYMFHFPGAPFFFPLSNLGSLVWCWIEVITVGILILIFRRTLLTLTIRLGLCSRFFIVTFINVFPSLFFNLQWVLNFIEFFCIYLLRWLHGVLEWHQRNRTDRTYSWYS